MAQSLAADAQKLGPRLLPELVRLVLEKGADQLDQLLPDKGKPERHLLVTALKGVLAALARPVPGGAIWKPVFGAEDALKLAEAVVDEVVANPQWVIDRAGKESRLLADVVEAVLDALRSGTGLDYLMGVKNGALDSKFTGGMQQVAQAFPVPVEGLFGEGGREWLRLAAADLRRRPAVDPTDVREQVCDAPPRTGRYRRLQPGPPGRLGQAFPLGAQPLDVFGDVHQVSQRSQPPCGAL